MAAPTHDMNDRDLSLCSASFLNLPITNDQNNPSEWLPVHQWKPRHSPQSNEAIRALLAYYDLELLVKPKAPLLPKDVLEHCWNLGWRWTWKEVADHAWYPPAAVVAAGQPGVVKSPRVVSILEAMDEPGDRERWATYLSEAADKTAARVARAAEKKADKKRRRDEEE